jgi:hypothetical protein
MNCRWTYQIYKDTRESNSLRQNATSHRVAGSNPNEAAVFLNWSNPFSMALGSTQPPEMSTRNLTPRISLTTSPPSVSLLCRICGSLDFSQRYGPRRPLTGIVYLAIWCYILPFLHVSSFNATSIVPPILCMYFCDLHHNCTINSTPQVVTTWTLCCNWILKKF